MEGFREGRMDGGREPSWMGGHRAEFSTGSTRQMRSPVSLLKTSSRRQVGAWTTERAGRPTEQWQSKVHIKVKKVKTVKTVEKDHTAHGGRVRRARFGELGGRTWQWWCIAAR